MEKPKIPDGSSIEELARFWDTHDATAFWDEFEDLSEPIFEDFRRTHVKESARPGSKDYTETI